MFYLVSSGYSATGVNHMGDDQWDAIEIFNSAFKERHEEVDSDDEYLI